VIKQLELLEFVKGNKRRDGRAIVLERDSTTVAAKRFNLSTMEDESIG